MRTISRRDLLKVIGAAAMAVGRSKEECKGRQVT
jgi:hypothetical protein